MKIGSLLLVLFIINYSCSDNNDPIIPKGWEKISYSGNNNFTDIEFVNNNFGVICGSYGTLLKTENGGSNWQTINTGTSHSFFKVSVISENEFYISRAGLYKTINKGYSFTELGNFSNYIGTIFDLHFFDANNGLIYKNGLIIKTDDSGVYWDTVYHEAGYASLIQFPSNEIGYITGGASWDGMSYGEMHKTNDGGNTWINIGNTPDIYNWEITAMLFFDEETGYFTNFNREFYKTNDGGLNWILVSDSLPRIFDEMVFLSNDEGYGLSSFSIFKTIDGGISWKDDYTDSSMVFSSLAKTFDNKLFVVGNDGVILRKKLN